MKAILKNCFATLCRHLSVTLLTLAGLVAAFVAFTLILMQVSFEFGYDRFRPAADRIYRVEMTSPWSDDPNQYTARISRFNAENIMHVSPAIEAAGLFYSAYGGDVQLTSNDRSDKNTLFRYPQLYCSAGFADVLQFEMVEGSSRFDAPDQALIPQSLARQMFGDQSPLGKHIAVVGDFINLTDRRDFYVSGVYKDLPANSQIKNALYLNEADTDTGQGAEGAMNHWLFFRLRDSAQKEAVEKALSATSLSGFPPSSKPSIRLQLLSDVYFDTGNIPSVHGSRRVTMIFVGIAILILGIALINFFNFSIALAPFRIQSVNMQKILGGRVRTIRAGLLGEAMLFSLAAYLLALFCLYGVERSSLMSYLRADMTLWDNPAVLVWGALIAMGVGAVAGAYPAYYTTSVPAAITLKGAFGLSLKGRWFRTALTGFQYVISIGLMIAALFMNLQYRLVRNDDMGFNRDQVLAMGLSRNLIPHNNAFAAALRQNPAVQEVGFCKHQFITSGGYQATTLNLPDGTSVQDVSYRQITPEMIPLLGLKIYEGRGFVPDDTLRRSPGVPAIMNRTAQEAYNLKLGDRIGDYTIVGFVENFNFQSLHTPLGPFFLLPSKSGHTAYVKINTDDYASVIASLVGTARRFDPNYDGEPRFIDSIIDQMYRGDSQKISLVTFFSLLAIVISLSGVLALVSFETRHKRKQIGLRRVFGASVGQVLALFNRIYIRVVVICFLIAAPLAWYGVQQWLQQFTVRVPMYWWVFAAVLLAVGALTALTVTWLSYRVATDNPVKALKTE